MLNFYKQSENFLAELADIIEKQDTDSIFDVEYSDGILTILVHKTDQEYVINRHSANQKIWYSSPLTGANYFSFDQAGALWLSSKGEELKEKLFAELKAFK
ncbi:MAG: iron donor protein CyaY [Rickettsiales bacterium]|nr:iron donor protein CyaY [Rickettsiales bacterium]